MSSTNNVWLINVSVDGHVYFLLLHPPVMASELRVRLPQVWRESKDKRRPSAAAMKSSSHHLLQTDLNF